MVEAMREHAVDWSISYHAAVVIFTALGDSAGLGYLAAAVLAGLPAAVVYLIFQRRVTQAIVMSAGIKG